MGCIAAILLAVGIVFSIWPPSKATAQFLQGSCIKSGLVLGAAWLAYPQLNRLPSWLFSGLIVLLIAAAVRPRVVMALSRYAVILMPLLFAIWLLRRLKRQTDGRS
jgi:hypothetical protein